MTAKNLKNRLILVLSLLLIGYSNQIFAQEDWNSKPKIIITQMPKIVPKGKRWVLATNEKTTIQISDGTLNSGTLCNGMFLSNPQIIFNINKGDYRDPETFGIIFKNLEKVPYTNDITYKITPISIIDKTFSLSDLQYKSPENAGQLIMYFDEGESVYVSNCLESIELTEIETYKLSTVSFKSGRSYCDGHETYVIKLQGHNATIYYTDLEHLDRSYKSKGYLKNNKIYVKEQTKYVCEFAIDNNHKLLMFDNNAKKWISLNSCEEPLGNADIANSSASTNNQRIVDSKLNNNVSNTRIDTGTTVIVGLIQRSFIMRPFVSNDEHLKGNIVIKFTCNRKGDILDTYIDDKFTTISDSVLLKRCIDAIKHSEIYPSDQGPDQQRGLVMFLFKGN